MTERFKKIIERGPLGITQLIYVVYEAKVSTNDTITLGELPSVRVNACFRQDNGQKLATSTSGNIIIITEGTLTNMPIVGLALAGQPEGGFPYTLPYILS